jgi:hypothetical protein
MSERKIDIYNHVMPRAVADRIRELAPARGCGFVAVQHVGQQRGAHRHLLRCDAA